MRCFDRLIRSIVVSLVILCWGWIVLLPSLPAVAQSLSLDPRNISTEQRLSSHSGFDPNNIPSEKVSQFVQACLQVVTLIERRESELQAAEIEAESTRIEQEIEAEALAIIERNGLTRQEYLQLLGLANTDPEFGERVAIQLQETSS